MKNTAKPDTYKYQVLQYYIGTITQYSVSVPGLPWKSGKVVFVCIYLHDRYHTSLHYNNQSITVCHPSINTLLRELTNRVIKALTTLEATNSEGTCTSYPPNFKTTREMGNRYSFSNRSSKSKFNLPQSSVISTSRSPASI